mgnify:CR=1 FL=1
MDHLVDVVTQASVAVDGIAHVQHFVLAVKVYIGHANLVRLGVPLLVVIFPLLNKLAVLHLVGNHHAVETLVCIAVLEPCDDTGRFTVKVSDFHHADQRPDTDIVLGRFGRLLERSRAAIVGNAHDQFRIAVAVDIIDRCTVPHAHVKRRCSRSDVVLVRAVRPHVHCPQVPSPCWNTLRVSARHL